MSVEGIPCFLSRTGTLAPTTNAFFISPPTATRIFKTNYIKFQTINKTNLIAESCVWHVPFSVSYFIDPNAIGHSSTCVRFSPQRRVIDNKNTRTPLKSGARRSAAVVAHLIPAFFGICCPCYVK